MSIDPLLRLGIVAALAALAACRSGPPASRGDRASHASGSAPVGGQLSATTHTSGEWTMAPGDYANMRFSTLTDIHTGNVTQLREAWSFSTGTRRSRPRRCSSDRSSRPGFALAMFAAWLGEPERRRRKGWST